MPTNITLVKFLDNPTTKTVKAVMSDGSEIILTDISYDNYTNPPGYMIFSPSQQQIENIEIQRALKVNQYYTSLNKVLST